MQITPISPGTFESSKHWYPNTLNATIHPMVLFFLNMRDEQILSRYCHLHPNVKKEAIAEFLSYKPKYFTHSGTDLIHVATENGNRRMVVIETNSSPSGQKSMPLPNDFEEQGAYKSYIEKTFKPILKQKRKIQGALGVIYDKNLMEASGYAHAMSDAFNEEVFLIPFFNNEGQDANVRVVEGVIEFQHNNEWKPLRAVFRYVTQKPWNRLPLIGKTVVFNPIITCLAGGRNKLVASKAYEMFNAENKESNLKIFTPETIWDVGKAEIPLWVERMGGRAVVKVPYSNAGQGVYTIVDQNELDEFMNLDFDYDKFIVQALIGNHNWSSEFTGGKFYHVGTVPDTKMQSYAMDIRMIVHATNVGFRPLSMYARRAKAPLAHSLTSAEQSWAILGTNLSIKEGSNQWSSDTDRLMLMDRKGFNKLGVGLDDLIDGFIQSVMATVAIDKMCQKLITSNGKFRKKLFQALNNDDTLINEIHEING